MPEAYLCHLDWKKDPLHSKQIVAAPEHWLPHERKSARQAILVGCGYTRTNLLKWPRDAIAQLEKPPGRHTARLNQTGILFARAWGRANLWLQNCLGIWTDEGLQNIILKTTRTSQHTVSYMGTNWDTRFRNNELHHTCRNRNAPLHNDRGGIQLDPPIATNLH